MSKRFRLFLLAQLFCCFSFCALASPNPNRESQASQEQNKPAPESATNLDTAKIDSALGRGGAWIEGVYLVTFPRTNLAVMLEGVRLSTAHVLSFVTFTGSEENSQLMGEFCVLPDEVAGSYQIGRAHV